MRHHNAFASCREGLVLTTIGEKVVLVIMFHLSVWVHKIETVIEFAVVFHRHTSCYGAIALLCRANHPFDGLSAIGFCNASGRGGKSG